MLILGYMGKQEMMYKANLQRLLGGEEYAKRLRTYKSHITKSFQKLEEMGYIKHDKKRKELTILINLAMAYNGKAKDFTKTWNQLAIPFANPVRKIKNETDETKGNDLFYK